MAIRARRPVSAQRAPSTAQPPIASTSSTSASRKKLRRLRSSTDEDHGAARPAASAATTIRRHPFGGSAASMLRGMPGHWELIVLGLVLAACLRRQAGAADRTAARPQRPRAEGHRQRRRPAGGHAARDGGAGGRGACRRNRPDATSRPPSRPARRATSRSARPSRFGAASSFRIVSAWRSFSKMVISSARRARVVPTFCSRYFSRTPCALWSRRDCGRASSRF